MNHHHILLISQHPHGHLNPSIQLAINLTRVGARVTLATTISGFHKLKSLPPHHNLSFASFSDGHDDDPNAAKSPGYVHDLKRLGSENLANLIQTMSKTGNKITLLVFTLFLPWAGSVARQLNIPSALFLIQTATSFSIYNRLFNSRDGIFTVNKHIDSNNSFSLKLPGLPMFKQGDLPTFALPNNPFFADMSFVMQQHLQFLDENPNTHVLINTLNGLEHDSVKSIQNSVVVGPLVNSFSVSIDQEPYFQWLDLQSDKSVVFVSFGSMSVLTKTQKEEILHGLIEFKRPFLLVLREDDIEINELNKKVGGKGLIVGWCAQTKVLNHRSIACFVTHCGWNSVLESMVAGVAVVGYPLFADQTTNAKMVEEVWGNGVRIGVGEGMVVVREEVKRCLKVVMGGGERAEGIKKRVEKWKKVAEEMVEDGGSLMLNLKLFLESVH
ncbi:hypothetical protein QVD17_37671 [Tagetes erecta]|uniref:Glycosyltransferase n=1 Tax=Tagetes erecta TaxID=13708 RepID=A0AAD8JV26_TARER|nr:hypothetical protein QVD17_37671 [Tagetes erecta]